ncbi:MAG: sulfatase-like hydrolase/transferase [Planctomycetes bacterium]|nr:sulfatase-like hydrolase/transferase [Planctomycetota bacterium]
MFQRLRRAVSRGTIGVLSVLLIAAHVSAAPVSDDAGRPNILLIITDQQHAGMMRCAGNRWVKTPAMDSLAATGARFERAYATNPVCIPSRVSMMTGHMPSHFGMRSNDEGRNQASPRAVEQGMGWIFRNQGYETAHGGKTHWMRGMNPESIGFKNIARDQREGLAETCVDFLEQKHEKPFLLVASFINPHDICYMAIDDYTQSAGKPVMYARSVVERERLGIALRMAKGVSRAEFFERFCPPLPENYEVPALEPECVTTDYLGARAFRAYARDSWSDQRWREHRWAYCRLTEMVDAQIGQVLDALGRQGLEETTAVVFTSDHGDLDSAHRLEHKSIPYEEAARVPLIVSQKGATKAGLVDTTHLVAVGLDLIPTLCDYAGIEPPSDLRGRSVRPLAEGRDVERWRSDVVVETRSGRMLRTDRFKYIVYQSGKHREQLIDLVDDPGEMVNLAEDSKYGDVLNDHRRRLGRWVDETNDEIAAPYIVPADEGSAE